jgi:hypothetical protein
MTVGLVSSDTSDLNDVRRNKVNKVCDGWVFDATEVYKV